MSDWVRKLSYGAIEVSDGAVEVSDGVRKVSDGLRKVCNGTRKVSDGVRKVSDGTRKVSNGVRKVSGRCQMVSGKCQIVMGRCHIVSWQLQRVACCQNNCRQLKTIADMFVLVPLVRCSLRAFWVAPRPLLAFQEKAIVKMVMCKYCSLQMR